MSCQENAALIHGYLDGELDLVHSLRFEDHLRECAECAQKYRSLQALRTAVRGGGLYFQPAKTCLHGSDPLSRRQRERNALWSPFVKHLLRCAAGPGRSRPLWLPAWRSLR